MLEPNGNVRSSKLDAKGNIRTSCNSILVINFLNILKFLVSSIVCVGGGNVIDYYQTVTSLERLLIISLKAS